VIWTDYQNPISHIERWGFVAIKGSSKGGNHNQQSTADLPAGPSCPAIALGGGGSLLEHHSFSGGGWRRLVEDPGL